MQIYNSSNFIELTQLSWKHVFSSRLHHVWTGECKVTSKIILLNWPTYPRKIILFCPSVSLSSTPCLTQQMQIYKFNKFCWITLETCLFFPPHNVWHNECKVTSYITLLNWPTYPRKMFFSFPHIMFDPTVANLQVQ